MMISLFALVIGGIVVGGLLAALVLSLPRAILALAVNPFWVLATLLGIGFIDFARAFYVLATGGTLALGAFSISDVGDVQQAFMRYTILATALVLGASFGLFFLAPNLHNTSATKASQSDESPRSATPERIAFWALWLTAAFTFLVLFGSVHSGRSIFEITAARQILARDFPISFVLLPLFMPALAFLHARIKLVSAEGVVTLLAATVLAAVTLGRGSLLLISIIAALSFSKRRRLTTKAVFPALVVAIITFDQLRVVQREWATRDAGISVSASYSGLVARLFDSTEIAIAEAMSALVSRADIGRTPVDTIVAAIALPLPRAVFPWKPLPPSTYFTQIIDPLRWATSMSELTVTGFGNLWLEQGWGAVFACFAVGGLFSAVSLRSLGAFPRGGGLVGLAYTAIITIAMFRGDIFIATMHLWHLALVGMVLIACRATWNVIVPQRRHIIDVPAGAYGRQSRAPVRRQQRSSYLFAKRVDADGRGVWTYDEVRHAEWLDGCTALAKTVKGVADDEDADHCTGIRSRPKQYCSRNFRAAGEGIGDEPD